MGLLSTLKVKILCFCLGHDWTCKADHGITPTPAELRNPKEGFWVYAQMYCHRCGKNAEVTIYGDI